MPVFLHHLGGVSVGAFVFAVGVGMAVNMLVFMGVNQFSVLMFMGMDMVMLVSMLQGDGVFYHQHGSCDHDCQTNIELHAGSLVEQEDAEQHTQERS